MMTFLSFRDMPLIVKIVTAPILCLLGALLVSAIAYDGMATVGATLGEAA